MRDPAERLRHILEAIDAVDRYLDRGREEFDRDELLQRWFVSNIQTIGEAAKALPEEVRAAAPEVPWPEIIGMRNTLVHNYFNINTDIVWVVATRDLPVLRQSIERVLKEMD